MIWHLCDLARRLSAAPKLSLAFVTRLWLGSAFSCHVGSIEKCLHERLAEAPAALMGALFVVDRDLCIQVKLESLNAVVDFPAESNVVELAEQHLVELLADAVGLRALHLSPGVVDILDGEVELILVPIMGTAILGATVGEHPVDAALVLIEEGITRSLRTSAAVSGILRV